MAVGLLLLLVLVMVERHVRQPVLVLGLFADRERVGAYLARALFLGAMMGFFLFTSRYLQDAWGWTPLAAGLSFLPMTIVNFAVAMAVPRLQRRTPGPVLLVGGLALATLGMAGLGLVGQDTVYWLGIGVPMALIGAGQGLAFGPLTSSGIARVDAARAGAASGVVSSVHQLGGALGMSLVVAISTTYPGAMRAGAVLLAAALAAAAVLVVPAARARRAG
jgi:predicted MFS family arabinose efflux permease